MSIWKQLAGRLARMGQQCIYCGREIPQADMVCEDCAENEQSCYAQSDGADGVPHVFRYEGVVRSLIHKLKYDDRKDLAIFAGGRMAEYYKAHSLSADLITFVPVHGNRMKMRGFDQSACMAGELARRIGVPCEDLLVRVRDTKPQFDLSRKERIENVREAFALGVEEIVIAGKQIFVVDDIYTTGSTMRACIACLAAAKQATPFAFSREYADETQKRP